jgi:hypothetical protein
MRLSEFIVLNEADKKRSVMQQGVLLAKRTSPDSIVFLFQLEDYYIETYCNAANKIIEEYRILPGTDALKHYLEAIPIDDLMN